jgi:predicted ATPase/class 3 adenylate cyclase/Tfp pilus assembly protein PilF
MLETLTLVMTDIVDSTQLNERLGDERMRALWERHDRLARDLIRDWRGIEVGRGDGFLVLFDAPADAVAFALDYHRGLAGLGEPLRARAGVHSGAITLRANRTEDRDRGATPYEIDGVALPITARVMSVALGGQTLATDSTLRLLPRSGARVMSHGHWRLKGVTEPVELIELGGDEAPFVAPPDSEKAYRVVRHGDSWATLRELANNLPAERGSFVGRVGPLRTLGRLFNDGARLVTVVGIGGVGKTRLAMAYGRGWLGDYPGGAWFCDLNAARTVDGIAHGVAQGLQIAGSASDPIQQIGAAIAGRGRCLVILDTFEQIARHAEETLGVWLSRAPEAVFLVTSREVLGIAGEHAHMLPPLDAAEAEALFRQRIDAAGLPGRLQEADALAIPALMSLLDRLPLAIELAAARACVMPPAAMLLRMGERFKLLVRRGERHDRQNTLRATLDWSWELLSPGEKAALMQLAVFEAGIPMEAAEAVVGPGLPDPGEWVPDLLQGLMEKSLLLGGAQRFELLRAVQDYAGERLAQAGLTASAQARHWRWFGELDEARAVARQCEDAENIVIACRRAAVVEPSAAVPLLRNAWATLRLTGPFNVALGLARSLETALAETDPGRAVVQSVKGAAAMLLGDFEEARHCYASAIVLASAAGDAVTRARTQCLLAQLELGRGDAEAAERVLAEVRVSPAMTSNAVVRFMCLNEQGLAALQRSHWKAARGFFAEALALAEERADGRWQGGMHGNLGAVARAEGHNDDALAHLFAALRWAHEVGDRQWAGNTHCNLGLLLHETGKADAAVEHLQTALNNARIIGHPRLEATVLCNLGLVETARGDPAAALAHHAQAALVAERLGDRHLEGQARGYLGQVLAQAGRTDEGLVQLGQAATLLRQLTDPTALALVLLQTVEAWVQGGDPDAARGVMQDARALLDGMTEGLDPELAGMLAKMESMLRTLRTGDRELDPNEAAGDVQA